jgi:hypothetical protein
MALADFIRELQTELQAGDVTWENPTLERYLGALAAWTEDMDGYFANQGLIEPAQPSWSLVARMLLAASLYE